MPVQLVRDKKEKKGTRHFLISIRTWDRMDLHAYVMCLDESDVSSVAHDLMDQVEKQELHAIPILLCTDLSDKKCAKDVAFLRSFICERSPEAREKMAEATDFHYSGFVLSQDDPTSIRLMKLH